MKHEDIRKKFIEFFAKMGHTHVPSSSLLPDDPSVLLTTAGMQQFKKYFTGELDPMQDFKSKNTVSIQKCFRTSDIDEVGDERHLTFFEMLGNFSFGGYWKKEAIQYAYDFVVGEMGLKIDYVTVFAGEPGVPADLESEKIWKSIDKDIEVKKFSRADNFWGPTGNEGPCGPTTEIYVDGIEIWNVVFNQYYQKSDKTLEPLKIQGIDTGMGLERLAMVSQKKKNVFETDLFSALIDSLPTAWTDEKIKRVLADHARAIVFLISDGIRPSNKSAEYILRRLIRRSIVYIQQKQGTSFSGTDILPMGAQFDMESLLNSVINNYSKIYHLDSKLILSIFNEEREKFGSAFRQGIKEIKKSDKIDAKTAFKLYETYGLPYESIKDFGGAMINFSREEFDKEFARHQEISRAGQEKKFGGHGLLLDTGELKAKDEVELKKVTRLHTATHLLQAALRKVLGPEVSQKGSDITAERTRFDFAYPRKLTGEEIKKVEDLVNGAVEKDLPMQYKEMAKSEAEKTGALYFFREKYPEKVKVYFAGKSLEDAFSKEFCGGPHVTHTGEVGKLKIAKEEAVGAGIRRIRGTILP